jgi:hypothetical protein
MPLQRDQVGRLAKIQPLRNPSRLAALNAAPVEQIGASVKLEQDPAEEIQFPSQRLTDVKWLGRDAPCLAGKQAVRGQ